MLKSLFLVAAALAAASMHGGIRNRCGRVLRIAYFLVLCVSFAIPGIAQRLESRFTAGVTTFADDASVEHLTVGGALRAYVLRRWSVEPEFLYMRHHGDFLLDRDHVVWGNFAYDFPDWTRRVDSSWHGARPQGASWRGSGRDQSTQPAPLYMGRLSSLSQQQTGRYYND